MTQDPQASLMKFVALLTPELQEEFLSIYHADHDNNQHGAMWRCLLGVFLSNEDGGLTKQDLSVASRSHPRFAHAYINHFRPPKRLKRFEDVIIQDPRAASQYAVHIIRKPWPRAESIIITDETSWVYYVREFNSNWESISRRNKHNPLLEKYSEFMLHYYEK